MKHILCFLLVFFCAQVAVDAQVDKVIHQTFEVGAAKKINITVTGERVDIRPTKGSRVLVETTVELSNANARLLDYIVNNGRYDLVSTQNQTNNELELSSIKTRNVIMIRGKECKEKISYVIYIPESVEYANNSTIETASK